MYIAIGVLNEGAFFTHVVTQGVGGISDGWGVVGVQAVSSSIHVATSHKKFPRKYGMGSKFTSHILQIIYPNRVVASSNNVSKK